MSKKNLILFATLVVFAQWLTAQSSKYILRMTDSIAKNPKNVRFYILRASHYRTAGYFDSAFTDINKAAQLEPKNAKVYGMRGSIYESLNNYTKAMADYTFAVSLEPRISDYYKKRSDLHVKMGNLKLAHMDIDSAIKYFPDYPMFLQDKAAIYEAEGNYEKAIVYYNGAMYIGKGFVQWELFAKRGFCYAQLKNYSKSIEECTVYIDQYKKEGKNLQTFNLAPKAFLNRGLCYLLINDYEKGKNDFSDFILLDNTDPSAYFLRGNCHYMQNNIEAAKVDLKNAIRLDPTFENAKALLNKLENKN